MKKLNPAGLGLFAFAFSACLLSLKNAGWFGDEAMPLILAIAITYGGFMQFVAGVMEGLAGDTFGFVAFNSFAAFLWSFVLFVLFFSKGVPPAFVGCYLFAWGVFSLVLWIATFKFDKAIFLIFLTLWVTYMLLALGNWIGPSWGILGGYAGLACGLLAGYRASAIIINDTHGKTVLPLGEPFMRLTQKPVFKAATSATTT